MKILLVTELISNISSALASLLAVAAVVATFLLKKHKLSTVSVDR